MDKLESKLRKTPANGDVLAATGDFGYAIWLGYDYAKKRVRKGKVQNAEFVRAPRFPEDEPLEYAVWTPSKYNARSGPGYAFILTVPDSDVKPSDHLVEQWTDGTVRDGAILAAPQMPEDPDTWETAGVANVMFLYGEITKNYAVDFDRIYLAGRGRGVQTALAIGESFPDRFAGVIGRAGDPGDTAAGNFRNLATYFAGGGGKATAFSKQIEELGYGNCSLDPSGGEEDIWNWILAHPRVSYPTEVTLIPNQYTNRAYWLQVPRTDGATPVKVHAVLDRATNTVTVEGEGVNEFSLHFSDAILDMNREITVIANGQEYKDLIPRSFRTALSNIYNARIAPGKVLVASKPYHLPSLAKEEDEGGGQ